MTPTLNQMPISAEDQRILLDKVVPRAIELLDRADIDRSPISVYLDLRLAHTIIPLDMEGLATAPGEDFAHDIGGILGNINRETGTMDNCFCPRTAR